MSDSMEYATTIDRLHNQPPEPVTPEPVEAKAAPEDKRIAELIEAATEWARQFPTIESEEVASACTDYLNQLDAQWEEFEDKRKAEREPHNQALKKIQEKWLPRLDRIDICRRAIRPVHRGWLRLKDVRLKAERETKEREAAEAQRHADQLAEQAKAGGPNAVSQTIIALEATQAAERSRQEAAAVPQRAQLRGTLGGRTHSLRTEWQADIVEIEKTFEHYKSRREVIELLSRLAKADVRNPRLWRNPEIRYIPGCHCYSEQV